MKKKTLNRLLWLVGSSVFLFFYFWGLSYWGEQNRNETADTRENDIVFLQENWKMKLGDDPTWASPDFSDSTWTNITSLDSFAEYYNGELAWFRLSYEFSDSIACSSISFVLAHYGASEFYFDGKKITEYGKTASNIDNEIDAHPVSMPIITALNCKTRHCIAIKYSFNKLTDYRKHIDRSDAIFGLSYMSSERNDELIMSSRRSLAFVITLSAFIFAFSLIHLLLYLFYKKSRENLFFSLFAFFYSCLFFCIGANYIFFSTFWAVLAKQLMYLIINPLLFLSLLLFVFSIYEKKFPKITRLAIIASAISIFSFIFFPESKSIYMMTGIWLAIFTIISMITTTLRAIKEKKAGAKILGVSVISFALFIFFIISILFYSSSAGQTFSLNGPFILAIILVLLLCIPISMSIYLAYASSRTSKNLEQKLIEVENLSAKTIEQEKEKQQLLATQNEMLEEQVEERTAEINEQKKQIEEKNKDITDSINYAKRIQDAILPSKELKQNIFPNAFILFKPKDIVSGDFYWFAEKNGKKIIASADCTGHGVPGALMSMIGNNMLNKIVNEKGVTNAAEILTELHTEVRSALKQETSLSESKDGMDISLIVFNSDTEAEFAGANRPLWLCRKFELQEFKGDKFSIGGLQTEEKRVFTLNKISLEKNDCVYIFSDGFADQFGGDTGKKFMTKNFKQLLCAIHDKTPSEQENILDSTINTYRGNNTQVDDILVIGIKI